MTNKKQSPTLQQTGCICSNNLSHTHTAIMKLDLTFQSDSTKDDTSPQRLLENHIFLETDPDSC